MANPEHLEILNQGVEAWNKWRREHLGVRPDLSGADLSGANLINANLINANLSRTNLSSATLKDAILRRTYLYGTDFRDANLSGADFTDVRLGDTSFVGNDLSEVKGLERAIHDGPSSIGVNTLYKSGGKI